MSWLQYWRDRKLFRNVDTYVCFIGYPRSGSTLVQGLLDAHPRVLIANELHASRYIHFGFRRQQMLALLRRHEIRVRSRSKRPGAYDYTVPGAPYDDHSNLKVIGDKRAGGFTWDVSKYPGLFSVIRRRMGMRLRVIHVVRNPYDQIATDARKSDRTTAHSVRRFTNLATIVRQAMPALDADEVYHVWHEDLVADPTGHVKALCEFLGVEADPAYLDACASIVFASPRRTRDSVTWTQQDVENVEAVCQEIDFLNRYSGSEVTVQPA